MLTKLILPLAVMFGFHFSAHSADTIKSSYWKCTKVFGDARDLSERGKLKSCLTRNGLYTPGCSVQLDGNSYVTHCSAEATEKLFGTKVDGCLFRVYNEAHRKANFYLGPKDGSPSNTCKYDGYTLASTAVFDMTDVKRKSDSSWEMPDIVFPILLRDKFNRSNVVIREIEPVADFATRWDSNGTTDENPVFSKWPNCETLPIPNLISKLNDESRRKDQKPPEKLKEIDSHLKKTLGDTYEVKNRLPTRSIVGYEKNVEAHYPVLVEIIKDSFSLCGKKIYSGQLLKFAAYGDECNLRPYGSLQVSGIPISENEKPRANWLDGRKVFRCRPKSDPYEDNINFYIRARISGSAKELKNNQLNFESCECREDQYTAND